MIKQTLLRGLLSTVLGVLLLAAQPVNIRAQNDHEPARILISRAPALTPDQAAQAAALANALAQHLPDEASIVTTEAQDHVLESYQTMPGDYALVITAAPAEIQAGGLRLTWAPRAGFRPLFSPALEAQITGDFGLRLEVPAASSSEEIASAVTALGISLYHYATGNCPAALPEFDRVREFIAANEAVPINHPFMLDFYQAQCYWSARQYTTALDWLTGPARTVLRSQPDAHTLYALWDAYIADSYAQNFAFDRALAWDDRNLLVVGVYHDAANPTSDQLLAELYLLRGQHRLYLYEWDAVLSDYNAALALTSVPPRAYYYRGLLYYTQNARQAAFDDLQRYITLERDPDNPLLPLAVQYSNELEALLATPTPD